MPRHAEDLIDPPSIRDAVSMALDELGEPTPNYTIPVANAVELLKRGLALDPDIDRNEWEFFHAGDGWRWRVKDTNQKILFGATEGYSRLDDAQVCARRAGWSDGCKTSTEKDLD